jgi:hypothetical protein
VLGNGRRFSNVLKICTFSFRSRPIPSQNVKLFVNITSYSWFNIIEIIRQQTKCTNFFQRFAKLQARLRGNSWFTGIPYFKNAVPKHCNSQDVKKTKIFNSASMHVKIGG